MPMIVPGSAPSEVELGEEPQESIREYIEEIKKLEAQEGEAHTDA
jgi:hypothetical protein